MISRRKHMLLFMAEVNKIATINKVLKTDFDEEKREFYKTIVFFLKKNRISFLVGGGIAVREYAPDLGRPMKDLDLFITAGDYPKILSLLKKEGFNTQIIDERWLSKVTKGKFYVDFIFSSPNYMNPVDSTWFENTKLMRLFGTEVHLITPEDLIWCKTYIQDRQHYDGADINHIILNQGQSLNWKKLLHRMESHWEILFGILLNFRFVYPSERGLVPKWLMEELIERLSSQLNNPIPKDKICRGPILSRYEYNEDISQKHFKVIS